MGYFLSSEVIVGCLFRADMAPSLPPRSSSSGRNSAARPSTTRTIVSVAVASRVATVALMILGNALLPTHDAGGVHKFRPRTFPVPAGPGIYGRDGGVLSAFTRWDAAWFLSIADSGYPSPSWSGADASSRGEAAVDCGLSASAWDGEENARPAREREREQEQEQQEDGEERRRGDEHHIASARRQSPQCRRPDVPLQEQAHAFFPLYPWLVRWAAAALRALLLPIGLVLDKTSSLVFTAVLISNSCFVAAAVLLYRLGSAVTGDSLLAHRGALAFCVTPASVFFSTAYTESLFSALTFCGLLLLFSEGGRRRRRTSSGRGATTSSGSGVSAMGSGARTATGGAAGGGGGSSGNGGGGGGSTGPWWGGAVSAWAAATLLSLATLARSNGIAGAGVLVLEKLRWMAIDAGLFSHTDDNDDDNNDNNNNAETHARRPSSSGAAAAAAAAGSSPVAANTRSKRPGSRGDTRSGADGIGGSGATATATAAAAAAAGDGASSSSFRDGGAVLWLRLPASLLATALQALLVIAPYLLVQAYAYRKFCTPGAAGGEDGGFYRQKGVEEGATTAEEEEEALLHLIQRLHPWCAWRVPSLYAHVQSAYWDVGALRYYQWKQVPNFLLAAPALVLTAGGAARFFSAQRPRSLHAAAAAPAAPAADRSEAGKADGDGGEDSTRLLRGWAVMRLCPAWLERLAVVFFGPPGLPRAASPAFERTGAAALVAQWAFFAAFAAVCMNVQVSTRFLAAACPPLHWWTAAVLVGAAGSGEPAVSGVGAAKDTAAPTAGAGSRPAAARTWLRWYLGAYFVVGAVLHANFLPWT